MSSYSVQAIATLPSNEQIISTVSSHGKYETAVKAAASVANWLSDYSRSAKPARQSAEDVFVVENVGRDPSVVSYIVVENAAS